MTPGTDSNVFGLVTMTKADAAREEDPSKISPATARIAAPSRFASATLTTTSIGSDPTVLKSAAGVSVSL